MPRFQLLFSLGVSLLLEIMLASFSQAKPLEPLPIPYSMGVSLHSLGHDFVEMDDIAQKGDT